MRIGVPRALVVTMAALFSGYIIVLGLYAIDIPANPLPVMIAMILYALMSTVSLLPSGPSRMPHWMAASNVLVCILMPLLVTPQLDPAREGGLGYSTWYVAAIGTLMTITSTRRRHSYAWAGIVALVVQTVIWGDGMGGVVLLLGTGAIGSVSWVAVSHILSVAMLKASRDAARFAQAEREATDWQAPQEAHLYERQFRLGQTGTMAAPMLRIIESTGGELTDEQRQECLNLEGAIRDEIRGRSLLNDAMRREVMAARRRGVAVTLFDEGGLDDLDDRSRDAVLNTLAEALRTTSAQRVIARTAPAESDIAVTVVGLSPVPELAGLATAADRYGSHGYDDAGSGYEDDEDDEEVALWLEIPRSLSAAPVSVPSSAPTSAP